MLTGALRDPMHEQRGEPVRRLVGAARAPLPASWDLRYPGFRTPNQRGQSCYGNTWAQVFRTGSKGSLDVSAMAIWSLARQLTDTSLKQLPDVGVYTHKAVDALSFGLVRRDRWPDDVDLDARVPVDVLEAGADAKITNVYRIFESGPERTERIQQTVYQGHAVPYASVVGPRYQRYAGGVYYGEVAVDGHAQCIVGYRTEPDLSISFLVANSWGGDWGEGGCSWVSANWIESDNCYDFQIALALPLSVE